MCHLGYHYRRSAGMQGMMCGSYLLKLGVLATLALLVTGTERPSGVKLREYCQSEHFNVSCPHGQVLLMQQANYGRMRKGRCITGNYGNMGCSKDVLPYLDNKCSGRSSCQVYISDPYLHKMQPCTKDLTSYLEARHTCIAVEQGSVADCRRTSLLKVSSATVGYLSSFETSNHGYGTLECPWEIRVEAGQKIRFSLLRFGPGKAGEDVMKVYSQSKCYEIGHIIEGGNLKKRVTSCHGDDRERPFYTSGGSKTVVQFLSREVMAGLSPFFIKYEAVGCPTLTPPSGGSVKLNEAGDEAEVTCDAGDETWFLTCTDNTWHGIQGNCSQAPATWTLGKFMQDEEKFPFGILIVVAIGVALGVFFGGILLSVAAVYMKRKHRPYQNPTDVRRDLEDAYHDQKQYAEEHHPGTLPRDVLTRDGHYRVTYPDVPGSYCPRHTEGAYSKDSGYSTHTIPTYTGSASTKHVYESPQFS